MWIKICGIKDMETAHRVAALRPDAIGLNFYAASPRVVDVDVAAEIARELPPEVEPVGLFVNHAAEEILAISAKCGLKTVQLHGDEPPGFSAALPGLRIIRALRIGDDLAAATAFLDECRHLGTSPDFSLVDARVEGQYGGTGKTVSWRLLADDERIRSWPPLILSGGLTPENVGEAISVCRPWGVDVSSGVESVRAEKDMQLVEQFIIRARAAFAAL